MLVVVYIFIPRQWRKLIIKSKRGSATILMILRNYTSLSCLYFLLELSHGCFLQTDNVNPKELYGSVIFIFGHALTTIINAFITNSNEVRCTSSNELLWGRCLLWILIGAFILETIQLNLQISEYVTIYSYNSSRV